MGNICVKKSSRPYPTVISFFSLLRRRRIPKILRRYFLYDRKLLSDLSRCGWEALKTIYTTGVREPKAVPGAVVAIQRSEIFHWDFTPT